MVLLSLLAVALVGAVMLSIVKTDNQKIIKFLISHHWYVPFHVLVCLFCLPLGEFGRGVKAKSFGNLLSYFGFALGSDFAEFKERLFAPLKNDSGGKDNEKVLRILEIGAGSGTNFGYYPSKCEVIVEEPNSELRKGVESRIAEYPGFRLLEYLETPAESMSSIPDNAVDVVIGTNVLCSVQNLQKVLSEVQRVLKPGGKYYCFEHVMDKEGSIKRTIQAILNRTLFFSYCAEGCSFIDLAKELKAAGFDPAGLTYEMTKRVPSALVYCITPFCHGVLTTKRKD